MNEPDPRIFQPPPAPPGYVPRGSLTPSAHGGFQQNSGRTWLEVCLVVGFVIFVATAIAFGAGRLAVVLLPWVPLSVDRNIGQALAVDLPMVNERCSDPGAEAYVRTIAAPLLEALGDSKFHYEFRVSPDETPNAFALPGGYVTVNFGLLQAARSGDEVALVLAHELQHVERRHSTARALRNMSGTAILGLLFGGGDVSTWVSGMGDLVARGYDRGEEAEADLEGARLAAKAGIPPAALGEFMARLGADTLELPAWLGDHPATEERQRVAQSVPFTGPARTLPSPVGLACGTARVSGPEQRQ
jgi:beta-barrel assembly-enhancing protease